MIWKRHELRGSESLTFRKIITTIDKRSKLLRNGKATGEYLNQYIAGREAMRERPPLNVLRTRTSGECSVNRTRRNGREDYLTLLHRKTLTEVSYTNVIDMLMYGSETKIETYN